MVLTYFYSWKAFKIVTLNNLLWKEWINEEYFVTDEAWKSLFYFLTKQVKVFIAVIQYIANNFFLINVNGNLLNTKNIS